jgi:hypothetical protein
LAALRICGSGWWYNAWRASSSVARGPCPSIFFANKSALNHSPVFPNTHTRKGEERGRKKRERERGLKNRKPNLALDSDKSRHACECELIKMRVRDEAKREKKIFGDGKRLFLCICNTTTFPPSHVPYPYPGRVYPGISHVSTSRGISPVSQCEVEPH